MTIRRLTIYLLRDVHGPDDALAADKPHTRIEIPDRFGISGAFYYTSKPPTPPPWLPFVQEFAPTSLQLRASSAPGLLVLMAHERYFALTFGYGRSLLDLSKTEPQFGLRVALNRIDPALLRSMDTKTFEDLVVTRTTQTSKSTELPTFGIDISSDILRAVTGRPRDTTLARQLTGSDALVLGATKTPEELADVLGELMNAFVEETYKDNFSWIDQLALVSDRRLIEQLDSLAAAQLALGDSSSTHLAMPETISWEEIDSFKISGAPRGVVFDDLDIETYLASLGSKCTQITPATLRSRRVSVGFGRQQDDYDDRWSLYNCLISEQRIDDTLYVLIEGRWLSVSSSLSEDVDKYAESLPPCPTELIPSNTGETEPQYNRRMAALHSNDLLLLDAKIKVPGGASSGIELCDLLTSKGEFIHIKRKSRSSTLSHLFSQGNVSAATFLGDGTFRDKVREEIHRQPEDQRQKWLDVVPASSETVDRSRYTVSYAVIANTSQSGTDWLPFFSKLNLMQQGKQIQSRGFRLAISRVPIEE